MQKADPDMIYLNDINILVGHVVISLITRSSLSRCCFVVHVMKRQCCVVCVNEWWLWFGGRRTDGMARTRPALVSCGLVCCISGALISTRAKLWCASGRRHCWPTTRKSGKAKNCPLKVWDDDSWSFAVNYIEIVVADEKHVQLLLPINTDGGSNQYTCVCKPVNVKGWRQVSRKQFVAPHLGLQ